jgi:hypothetical protein
MSREAIPTYIMGKVQYRNLNEPKDILKFGSDFSVSLKRFKWLPFLKQEKFQYSATF